MSRNRSNVTRTAPQLPTDSPITTELNETENPSLEKSYRLLADAVIQVEAPEQVQSTAIQIITQAYNNEFFPGRNRKTTTGSALYLAFRIHREPRSVPEIASVINRPENELSRYNSDLQNELSLPVPPAPPEEFIDRFIAELKKHDDTHIPDAVPTVATELLEEKDDQYFSGRNPTVLAAAAIYSACLLERGDATQSIISHVIGPSEVSIRNTYKDLVEEYSTQ